MSTSIESTDASSLSAIERQSRSAPRRRFTFIDVWRGLAIVGVVIYHFGWDLYFFGFVPPSAVFNVPFTMFARALAGSFMFLAGVSLVLAHGRGVLWPKFLKRLLKLILTAAAISLVTYFAFPDAFIFFGILHSIAVASVLGLGFLFLPVPFVFLSSVVVLGAPLFVEASIFDTRALAWIGFSIEPPLSNDFEPIFPWFGVTLAGIGCTRIFLARQERSERPLRRSEGPVVEALTWIGKRTLLIYLVHQPVLFAAFVALTSFAPA